MLAQRPTRRGSIALVALVGAIAGVTGAAPAAAEAAQATGVEAYFRPAADDPDSIGATVVVLRTDAALPLDIVGLPRARARLNGVRTQMLTVSRDLHCYAVEVDVVRRGPRRRTQGRVGDRVRISVGRDGAVLDRRLEVRRMTPELARGGSLGCGEDPASKAVVFNMYPTPLVQPGRFFFTANSGPYLKDVAWTSWGAPTATGVGTYISECASCGPRQEYEVTITVDRLIDCPPYGAQAYDRLRFVRSGGAAPDDPRRRGISGEAQVYC